MSNPVGLDMHKYIHIGKDERFKFVWLYVRNETIVTTTGFRHYSGVKLSLNLCGTV